MYLLELPVLLAVPVIDTHRHNAARSGGPVFFMRKMNKLILALVFSAGISGSVCAADAMILERGDLKIRDSDVRNLIEAQVPPQHRGNVVSSDSRVRQMISNLFIVRALAAEARAKGLDKQETWNLAYQEDRLLAAKMLDALADAPPLPDFDAAAQEAYKADAKRFMEPEQVRAQHILISSTKRSDDEAAALAKKVYAEVKAGESSFEDLAAKYSEDPSAAQNKGDLGYFPRGKMVPAFEEAVFPLQKAGDVVGPVKTPFGYHVIRFVDRKAESMKPFESVKRQLVEEERTRLRKERREKETERIRSLDQIVVHDEALNALLSSLKTTSSSVPGEVPGRAE